MEGRKLRDNKRGIERGGGKETERNDGRGENENVETGGREREREPGERERGKRASRIAARFRDYSPAEDHREGYTLACRSVAENHPVEVSARRTTRAAPKKRRG